MHHFTPTMPLEEDLPPYHPDHVQPDAVVGVDCIPISPDVVLGNAFCPTGIGGGVDPTCPPGGSAGTDTKDRSTKGDTQDTSSQGSSSGVSVTGTPQALKVAHGLFGKHLTIEDFASIACAPKGATVTITNSGGKLRIVSEKLDAKGNLEFNSTREIFKPWFAPLTCKNVVFGLRGDTKGQGTELFAKQLETLKNAGVKQVITNAAGSPQGGGNGYYTWPRMGYEGKLTSAQTSSLPKGIQDHLKGSNEVRNLFDLKPDQIRGFSGHEETRAKLQEMDKAMGKPPGEHKDISGADVWRAHGSGIKNMKFKLDSGSRSQEALKAYLEERRNRSRNVNNQQVDDVTFDDPSEPTINEVKEQSAKWQEYDKLTDELFEMQETAQMGHGEIQDSPVYQAKSKRIDELTKELGIVNDIDLGE